MTAATRSARHTFAAKLRQAIDEKGVSVRSLSRKLNPPSPETARSNLMRWLRGAHRPSRTSRRAVAVALGLPVEYFDDEDEEDALQPMGRELLETLHAALGDALLRDEVKT